jgi:energy-coupling factor transporter ATP-binding protein EcfA2
VTRLEDMALDPGDRAVLIGASGCGKSTLANKLIGEWQASYCAPTIPAGRRGRTMILDDKPRFRATRAVTGKSPRARYRDFVRGDTVEGVVLDSLDHWQLAWDLQLNPSQTVIVQNPALTEEGVVRLCQLAAARFFTTQTPRHPSLLYVDEGMSFFGPTGTGRYGNSIQRSFRAGREKKLAVLLGAQRPKQINMQCLTEANIAFLFRLDFDSDVKRMQEMSFPAGVAPITEDQQFYWFRKRGRHIQGPLRLAL